MTLVLTAEPLHAAAFAAFGDVLAAPTAPGRVYFDAGLANARPKARPSLSMTTIDPLGADRLIAVKMERHEFSSQSFVPLDAGRYLVIVAPHAAGGGPDIGRARAFVATAGQGITYHINVWHHPLAVLDHRQRFAIAMWLETPSTDEEFFTVRPPFEVRWPAGGSAN
jgi:ureidoglycolate lyase